MITLTKEQFDKIVEKRFKILTILAFEVGVWEEKMQELANAIDSGHPKALEALAFYEDAIIKQLAVPGISLN